MQVSGGPLPGFASRTKWNLTSESVRSCGEWRELESAAVLDSILSQIISDAQEYGATMFVQRLSAQCSGLRAESAGHCMQIRVFTQKIVVEKFT